MNMINHILTILAKWLNIDLFALFRGMPECMFGPGPIHTVGLKHMHKAKHMRKCSAEQNWGGMVGFISTNLLCCPPFHRVRSFILCFSFFIFRFHCFFHSTISVLTSVLLCFQNNGLHKKSWTIFSKKICSDLYFFLVFTFLVFTLSVSPEKHRAFRNMSTMWIHKKQIWAIENRKVYYSNHSYFKCFLNSVFHSSF